jgi:hypothetical protein
MVFVNSSFMVFFLSPEIRHSRSATLVQSGLRFSPEPALPLSWMTATCPWSRRLARVGVRGGYLPRMPEHPGPGRAGEIPAGVLHELCGPWNGLCVSLSFSS